MQFKFQSNYFIIAILVVCLGILSRKVNGIPLFIGDILYAVMVYFLVLSFVAIQKNWIKISLPLTFCFCIEISQLIEVNWLTNIRNTTLGHYILGQGFLFSDLVCYCMGIALAFTLDHLLLKSYSKHID